MSQTTEPHQATDGQTPRTDAEIIRWHSQDESGTITVHSSLDGDQPFVYASFARTLERERNVLESAADIMQQRGERLERDLAALRRVAESMKEALRELQITAHGDPETGQEAEPEGVDWGYVASIVDPALREYEEVSKP